MCQLLHDAVQLAVEGGVYAWYLSTVHVFLFILIFSAAPIVPVIYWHILSCVHVQWNFRLQMTIMTFRQITKHSNTMGDGCGSAELY